MAPKLPPPGKTKAVFGVPLLNTGSYRLARSAVVVEQALDGCALDFALSQAHGDRGFDRRTEIIHLAVFCQFAARNIFIKVAATGVRCRPATPYRHTSRPSSSPSTVVRTILCGVFTVRGRKPIPILASTRATRSWSDETSWR